MITEQQHPAMFLSLLPSLWSFSLYPKFSPLYKLPRSRQTVCFAESGPSLSDSTLYGGDFAGLHASFSASNGALIKVPEHLVPEALLEWGAEPSAFEAIVSEDLTSSSSNDCVLTRQIVQILPAVGCGVDNLDTMKQEVVQQIQCLRISEDSSVISFDVPLLRDSVGIITTTTTTTTITLAETTFMAPGGNRLRVEVAVEYTAGSGFMLSNPIRVNLERQISTESSRGTIADGGGLTGSKVSELLGCLMQRPLFCDQPPLDWNPSGVKVLNLSGNITIATSLESKQDPWMLDIIYVTIDDDGIAEKQLVRRSYHAPESNSETAL
jgi:hypothetical protein